VRGPDHDYSNSSVGVFRRRAGRDARLVHLLSEGGDLNRLHESRGGSWRVEELVSTREPGQKPLPSAFAHLVVGMMARRMRRSRKSLSSRGARARKREWR